MAHRTALNTQIALLTGVPKHTVDRIGVNLNKGGLLHAGGRGRHAVDMEPEDLKNIILALLGADTTGKVFETVLGLHGLRTKDNSQFGEVFLEICSDPQRASEVMQVSVVRNFPQATIYWKDESGSRIGAIQDFRSDSERAKPGLRIIASISGTVIASLVKAVTAKLPAAENG